MAAGGDLLRNSFGISAAGTVCENKKSGSKKNPLCIPFGSRCGCPVENSSKTAGNHSSGCGAGGLYSGGSSRRRKLSH